MNRTYKKTDKSNGLIKPPFYIEACRTAAGMSMVISGIIGVSDYCEENIELLSHGGRIIIVGKFIKLKLLELNSVEIVGKIIGVNFKYGKN